MENGLALVTGANGFIGSHLVRELERSGYKVRGFVLEGTSTKSLIGTNCETFYGDITRRETLESAMKDVSLVFHLAGLVSDYGLTEDFLMINVHGTANVLAAAIEHRVKRFVFVSSIAVHPYGFTCGNENMPFSNENNGYIQSKIEAEIMVRGVNGHAIQTTVVRPGLVVFGPGECLPFLELVRALEKGRFAYIRKGEMVMSTSYVKNLVYGLRLAAESENGVGEVFLIADKNLRWRDFIEMICSRLDIKPPRVSVPFKLAYGIAFLEESLWRMLQIKNPPTLTRYRISAAGKSTEVSIEKARRFIGYEPEIGLDEALYHTFTWYEAQKSK
ncbi:MAG: NAD-dependent epimerase/dehydratase family protein [Patescibacteria group bacterium]